jgi:2-C-methyl-D-erythritol 4-phosphate cytidylyltransferase/2-C-methyl-D-erythritol 2,4-cyclodiphosphate synthase
MSSSAEHGVTFAAVIVAAGSGTRFGRSKHDLVLGGKALWQRCIDTFSEAGIDDVIVVGDVPGGVRGGARRRDSVLLGLEAFLDVPDWVLIHDAARPLVSVDLIRTVVDASVAGGADGVIPVVPVTDTVKRVVGDRVVATVERDGLVVVQTPQAFRFETLIAAHRTRSGADATDDATLVELEGGSVVVIEGERSNMKITYRGDLSVAESILERDSR